MLSFQKWLAYSNNTMAHADASCPRLSTIYNFTYFFVDTIDLPTLTPNTTHLNSDLSLLLSNVGNETITPFLDELALGLTNPAGFYTNTALSLPTNSTNNLDSLDIWTSYNDELAQETLSVPDVKLFYPEPFIASPSLVHSEIWFIHILHYQYWLWCMFISLIMFYLITFINIVRWCTLRTFP